MCRLVSRLGPVPKKGSAARALDTVTGMPPLTRRALLARAGAAATAAGAAGLWSSEGARENMTVGPTVLTGERRRRYAELVLAVVALEGGQADGGYVRGATAAFSGWYSRNAGLRPMVDHVLDEVVTAGGARRLLTDAGADEDSRSDAHFGTRGRRRRILAAEAVGLASPPYAPDRG